MIQGRRRHLAVLALLSAVAYLSPGAMAQDAPAEPTSQPANSLPNVGQVVDAIDKATAPNPEGGKDWSSPVKLAVVFIGLALLPSLLVMTTSFTRIVIVLAFVRRALTTQSIPPNIAIIGLALFLTLFTMSGTFGEINDQALAPYMADKMSFQDACA